MYGQVYLITNTVNGKRYVGLTAQSIAQRWKQHITHSQRKTELSRPICRAIRKHGKGAFSIEPIFSALDREALIEAEKHFIHILVPEYNASSGGETNFSLENAAYRARLSEKLKAVTRTPEARRAASERTKKHFINNPEARKRACEELKKFRANNPDFSAMGGKARKGVPHTEEHKSAISVANKKRCAERSESWRHSIQAAADANKKAVRCIETGVVYASCREASNAIGATPSMVSKAAYGIHKHTKGYRFEFMGV